jgi:YidC/Oxa1 family membrane protein insertase
MDDSQQTRMMLLMMPLFIGYLTISFPAGLGLYWVVSNMVQIFQQWLMNRVPASKGEVK